MSKAFLIFVLCCVVVISSHEGHYHESCDENGEGCHVHNHELDGHDHLHDSDHLNDERPLLGKGKGSSCKADSDCDRGLTCKRNRCSVSWV